jgi:hypothetical protein
MLFRGVQTNHAELPKVAYLAAELPLFMKQATARARLGRAPIRAVNEHQPVSTYQERVCRRALQPGGGGGVG